MAAAHTTLLVTGNLNLYELERTRLELVESEKRGQESRTDYLKQVNESTALRERIRQLQEQLAAQATLVPPAEEQLASYQRSTRVLLELLEQLHRAVGDSSADDLGRVIQRQQLGGVPPRQLSYQERQQEQRNSSWDASVQHRRGSERSVERHDAKPSKRARGDRK
jgi:hypothetical protein